MTILRRAALILLAVLCLPRHSTAQFVARTATPLEQAEAPVDAPFFHQTAFSIATTYYVNPDAAGASCSNTGLAAVYTSGTNGPLLNLNCLTARTVLQAGATTGLRVCVTGTNNVMDGYATYGGNGIAINGGGSVNSPVILSGCAPYAIPVITGAECYTPTQAHEIASAGTLDGVPYVEKVRQVFKLGGTYVLVEDVEVRCGFRTDIELSGSWITVRNFKAFGAYEDAIKVLVTVQHFYIGQGDISGFSSQAVDWYAGDYGFITRLFIHDAIVDPNSQVYVAVAIGMKGGVRVAAITRVTVTNLSSDGTHSVFSIGGAPNAAIDETSGGHMIPSAQYVHVMSNTIINFYGTACNFTGGVDSECSDNVISGTLGLAKIGTDPDVRNGDPTNYADQPLTSNAQVKRNRVSYLPVKCSSTVAGDSCFAINVANTAEAVGLVGDKNIYSSAGLTSPVYIYGGGQIDISAFRTASGTESTSTVITP